MSGQTAQKWILAIDFGAAIASVNDIRSAPIIVEVENSRYLPSRVYRNQTGRLPTGRAATRQAVEFPDRAELLPKRALVTGQPVLLGGERSSQAIWSRRCWRRCKPRPSARAAGCPHAIRPGRPRRSPANCTPPPPKPGTRTLC